MAINMGVAILGGGRQAEELTPTTLPKMNLDSAGRLSVKSEIAAGALRTVIEAVRGNRDSESPLRSDGLCHIGEEFGT